MSLFRIIRNKQYNFVEDLSSVEFKLFRKRIIGLILATDMAKHVADLSQFKNMLA